MFIKNISWHNAPLQWLKNKIQPKSPATINAYEQYSAIERKLQHALDEVQYQPVQAEIAKEAASIASIVRDARARLLADEVVELRASTRDRPHLPESCEVRAVPLLGRGHCQRTAPSKPPRRPQVLRHIFLHAYQKIETLIGRLPHE